MQQYKESDEAERYMTFYKISDWPYIAIIDPRTGEKYFSEKMDLN